MNIGNRINDMPMNFIAKVKYTLIYSLLIPFRGYAQSNYVDDSTIIVNHDTVSAADTLSIYEDSTIDLNRNKDYRFKASQLILPGTLIAVGTFGVYNGAFKKLDIKIKNEMDNLRGRNFFHADDYIQYLPAFTYLSIDFLGVKAKHNIKERIAIEATAYMSMAIFTNIGKYSFKEKRPDSGARNSFPSGHTTTVFTGAELMREEYGLWIGLGSYSVATAVAFLRLYNGRHWLNDIVAGAGIGILSARIGYWMLPIYQRWFKWRNKSSDTILIIPTYDMREKGGTLAIMYYF